MRHICYTFLHPAYTTICLHAPTLSHTTSTLFLVTIVPHSLHIPNATLCHTFLTPHPLQHQSQIWPIDYTFHHFSYTAVSILQSTLLLVKNASKSSMMTRFLVCHQHDLNSSPGRWFGFLVSHHHHSAIMPAVFSICHTLSSLPLTSILLHFIIYTTIHTITSQKCAQKFNDDQISSLSPAWFELITWEMIWISSLSSSPLSYHACFLQSSAISFQACP